MKNGLLLFFILSMFLMGCSRPKRDYPTEHKQVISHSLGSPLVIQPIVPPDGPFHLRKGGHYYYKATTNNKDIYYIDVGNSAWSIAAIALGSDDPIFKYTYYHKNKIGFYSKVTE